MKWMGMLVLLFFVGVVGADVTEANANEFEVETGTAPCTISDGYQTVYFDNGAVYSGSFKSCRPLAGRAEFVHEGSLLRGQARPINEHTILLETDQGSVEISLDVRQD